MSPYDYDTPPTWNLSGDLTEIEARLDEAAERYSLDTIPVNIGGGEVIHTPGESLAEEMAEQLDIDYPDEDLDWDGDVYWYDVFEATDEA